MLISALSAGQRKMSDRGSLTACPRGPANEIQFPIPTAKKRAKRRGGGGRRTSSSAGTSRSSVTQSLPRCLRRFPVDACGFLCGSRWQVAWSTVSRKNAAKKRVGRELQRACRASGGAIAANWGQLARRVPSMGDSGFQTRTRSQYRVEHHCVEGTMETAAGRGHSAVQ